MGLERQEIAVTRRRAVSHVAEPGGKRQSTRVGANMATTHDPQSGVEATQSIDARAALSIVFVGFLLTLVLWNIPASSARARLLPTLEWTSEPLYLDQNWGVFSPDPSMVSVNVHATVTFADGTIERYDYPTFDRVFEVYRNYRFRKYQRRINDDIFDYLRDDGAAYIARQFAGPDFPSEVTSVTLTRRFAFSPPLGSDVVHEWTEIDFHVYEPGADGGDDS